MTGSLKYVLDTNCYVDASRSDEEAEAFGQFCAWAAPRLYLSSVVAAELRAGAGSDRDRRILERVTFSPYVRRGRVVTPSAAAWEVMGSALSKLVRNEGLVLREVRRSFVFDVLIAASCRETGATLVSPNTADLVRIRKALAFEFVSPYPTHEA